MNEVATYLSFGLQTEHRPALTECEKGFESPTSRCKMKHRIDWDYVRYFLAVARGGLRFDENRGAAGQFSRSPLDVGRNEELAHEGSRALPHPFDRHLSRGPAAYYAAERPVGIVGPCSSGLQSRFEAAENRRVVPAGATRVTTAAATRRQVTIRWRGGEDVIDQPRKPERVIKSGAVSTSAPINWLRGVQPLRLRSEPSGSRPQ